jgi:hypothetical protein
VNGQVAVAVECCQELAETAVSKLSCEPGVPVGKQLEKFRMTELRTFRHRHNNGHNASTFIPPQITTTCTYRLKSPLPTPFASNHHYLHLYA